MNFIRKPYSIGEILAVVHKAIRLVAAERERQDSPPHGQQTCGQHVQAIDLGHARAADGEPDEAAACGVLEGREQTFALLSGELLGVIEAGQ